MERQSRRRQQALFDNNLTSQKELEQIDNALAKEEKRQKKKEQRRKELEASTSYAVVKTIATWMDKYFLDPLIGFVPVVGDTISSIVGVPFVYMSLFKVKSIPLTLAVVSNILIDVLLGLFPFLGNFFDIFHRSNLKNFKLIKGFVEDDREIIKKVNVRAVWMGFLIALLCWLIYLMIGVLGNVINGVSDKVSMLSSCVRGQADSQEEGVDDSIYYYDKELSSLESNNEKTFTSSTPNSVVSQTGRVQRKTFFYTEPELSTKRKAYLVEGDVVETSHKDSDFTYCSFTNSKGETTNGWILSQDLGQ